jgi:hypothetical protein
MQQKCSFKRHGIKLIKVYRLLLSSTLEVLFSKLDKLYVLLYICALKIL